MQQIKAITQKFFGIKAPVAPAAPVKALSEQQLRAISGGGPAGTWDKA